MKKVIFTVLLSVILFKGSACLAGIPNADEQAMSLAGHESTLGEGSIESLGGNPATQQEISL